MTLDLTPGKYIEIIPQTPPRHFCSPKVVEPPTKRCGCISCRVPCGITEEELEKVARDKAENRSYFFGTTTLGYQKPVGEAINPRFRDDYKGRPQMEQFVPKKDATNVDYGKMAEDFRSIDVYTGLVDGKPYGRFQRLYYQKRRHTRHPLGPEKRFCVPIANSMNYGWWMRDLAQLDETKWYATKERFPQVRGEITKFVDEMALHSPHFILF